jgi:hypothetical protein
MTLQELHGKAYESASIANDDYTSYAGNIAVTTITNGKSFNYIRPANISPARKAEKEQINLQTRTANFTLYASDSTECYTQTLQVTASAKMPSEISDADFKNIVMTKIENNESAFVAILNTQEDLFSEEITGINFEDHFEEVEYTHTIVVDFDILFDDGCMTYTIKETVIL